MQIKKISEYYPGLTFRIFLSEEAGEPAT